MGSGTAGSVGSFPSRLRCGGVALQSSPAFRLDAAGCGVARREGEQFFRKDSECRGDTPGSLGAGSAFSFEHQRDESLRDMCAGSQPALGQVLNTHQVDAAFTVTQVHSRFLSDAGTRARPPQLSQSPQLGSDLNRYPGCRQGKMPARAPQGEPCPGASEKSSPPLPSPGALCPLSRQTWSSLHGIFGNFSKARVERTCASRGSPIPHACPGEPIPWEWEAECTNAFPRVASRSMRS